MTIRSATIADAQALTAIYAYYVENTPITFETEVPSVQEFAERISLRKRLVKLSVMPMRQPIKNGRRMIGPLK
jgi:L-amino acid N-acyltransferase YncA